jgi:hypothetical protein
MEGRSAQWAAGASMPSHPKRIEPQKRKDPRARHIDGSATAWTAVQNRDPERTYVLVSIADDTHGPDYYESIGYEVEVYGGRKGASGVHLKGGRSTKDVGSPIEMRGHLLMSCSKERKEEIDVYGPEGDSGQQYADEIEQRLSLNKTKGRDALRGLGIAGEEYITFEKDIEAPRPVLTV